MIRPFHSKRIRIAGRQLGLCLSLLLLTLTVSSAVEVTWDGAGADNKWMTGLNWGGVAPVVGDSLLFSGTTKLTADNDFVVDTSFAGITFNSNAGAFILSGNRITLGGDLINNSASLQTLNLALILDATRTFNAASGNMIVSSIISGTGGLIKTGSGNLTLSGTASNTYAGLTSVNGGTLTLDKSAGVDAIAGNLEITSGGKVVFARSHQLKDSTIVTLSGVGSIFNGTAVNEGMPNSMVETIAGFTATGGTFNAGSNSNWTITGAGSFTGGAGNTLFVGNSGARLSFGSLSITGMTATAGGNVALANTFTLYGNSTVLSTITVGSGGLTLDGSRINLRRGGVGMSGSRLVLNGNVTVTGTTASNITEDISGGTAGVVNLELSGTTAPVDREFNVGVGGLTINVAITNGSSSAAGVTKTGNGTLTFSGGHANTYAGTTYINGGTLVLGQTNGVTAVAGDIVVNSGGTLSLTTNEQIANGAGITVNTGGTIAAWGRTETIRYYTQNGGGLTSSNNTGQVTITETMALNGGNVFTLNSSSTPAHFQAHRLELNGANLLLGGNNGAGIGRTAFTVGAGGLHMANGRNITLYRGTSGTVLNLLGNFTGVGSNSILVSVDGAVEPELNLGTEVRTFDIAASGNTNISVAIVGTGGITKTGDGTLTFSGNLPNTYNGKTTVSGGILYLNQTAGINAIAGDLEIASGGTLTLSTNEQIADGTGITVTGGTISAFKTIETIAYYTQSSGGFTTAGNIGNLNVTGTFALNGGINASINSSGANPAAWVLYRAELRGAGIIVGGNNGVGNPRTSLTIGEGGLLLSNRSITLNTGNAGTQMTLQGNVTSSGTSGILTGTGGDVNPILYLGTGTRIFDVTSGTTTLGVTATDTASIQKTGGGILAMTVGHSYSGGTTVSAGTLSALNLTGSATGTGALSVASSAILTGNGIIVPAAGQNITVNGNILVGTSTLAAAQTLTLTTSGLGTVEIGGKVIIDLFSGQGSGGLNSQAAADRLILGSDASVTFSSSSVLEVITSVPINAGNTAGWTLGSSWQIIDWSNLEGTFAGGFSNISTTAPGNFSGLPNLSVLGYAWDASALYTTGVISITLIPEPSRLFLLVLSGTCMFLRRRR